MKTQWIQGPEPRGEVLVLAPSGPLARVLAAFAPTHGAGRSAGLWLATRYRPNGRYKSRLFVKPRDARRWCNRYAQRL